MTKILEGFEDPTEHSDGNHSLLVYTSLEGQKPIVVLHELPGMTPSFVQYCRKMSNLGFKVYMPLMFKTADSEMSNFQCAKFCLSREFKNLFAGSRDKTQARPLTTWLVHFTNSVASNHQNSKIGVIGMCLTGGFSLVTFMVPDVSAVICCQPAYPFFFNIASLGLTETQRTGAAGHASRLALPCAKGYRFEKDRVCRKQHMKAVEAVFGNSFEQHPALPGRGHSTVTGDDPSDEVFEDIVNFLNARI